MAQPVLDTSSRLAATDIHQSEAAYIQENLLPRGEERNTWAAKEMYSYGQLLKKSTRPNKVTTKRINDSNILFHQGGRLVGSFDQTVTSLVSHQARRACTSRFVLRNYLKASEIPVPEGKVFSIEQGQNAVEYHKQLDSPVTVRPVASNARQGFSAGVFTEAHLAHAWERAAEACSALSPTQRQILVERHNPGLDLRLFVVGEDVAAALVRLPFFLVGDGDSSIGELREQLLADLEADTYLNPSSIKQTDYLLSRRGIDPSQVPNAGEVIILAEAAGSSAGSAITVDVTYAVSAELKQLAIDAMWAFPGLSATGVDLRVLDLGEPEGAVVTGVHPAMDFGEFRYPTYGKYRRVSMNIIEHMVHLAQL